MFTLIKAFLTVHVTIQVDVALQALVIQFAFLITLQHIGFNEGALGVANGFALDVPAEMSHQVPRT
jgi:hypothetical protein